MADDKSKKKGRVTDQEAFEAEQAEREKHTAWWNKMGDRVVEDRIYLAAPYTDPNPAVMMRRLRQVTRLTARMLGKKQLVYSPVAYSGALQEEMQGKPTDWAFWADLDRSMLRHWATRIWLLPLAGWRESVGVTAEIRFAEELHMPIDFKHGEIGNVGV